MTNVIAEYGSLKVSAHHFLILRLGVSAILIPDLLMFQKAQDELGYWTLTHR